MQIYPKRCQCYLDLDWHDLPPQSWDEVVAEKQEYPDSGAKSVGHQPGGQIFFSHLLGIPRCLCTDFSLNKMFLSTRRLR
jgi:hypothetical protein